MATQLEPKLDIVPTPCKETTKHFNDFRELLLKTNADDKTVFCEGDGYFSSSREDEIFKGTPPTTGEIPAAIAEEYVQLNNYHLQLEERQNIQTLLCGSTETWEAYIYLSNHLTVMMVQEGADLIKLVGELAKTTAASGKEFKGIAEKIKKAYDQAGTVQSAFHDLKQNLEKECNSDEWDNNDKIKEAKLKEQLDRIGKAANRLYRQAAQAHMSVVQAASIYALNDVAGLDAMVSGLKAPTEQFKKITDGNTDASAKMIAMWQKKYSEAIAAETTARGEYGKASTNKKGKEATFCFMTKRPEDMQSQKQDLLNIFNPKAKNPASGSQSPSSKGTSQSE
ncbi:MAG: hypothetical protein JNM22_05440 [Saprospiraceae bacterium]|nr:hypothetical protein [Saprospiraceae bacterium]